MKSTLMLAAVILIMVVLNANARDLIKNGEFDAFTGWMEWKYSNDIIYTKSIDNAGLLSGANSAKFEIESGGALDWYIQFSYNCPIQQKAKYYIRFMAGYESPQAPYTVHFTVRSPNDPWPIYYQQTPEVLEFEGLGPFVFDCDTTDGTTQLNFFIGGTSQSSLWLDSVSVVEEGPFWQNNTFLNIEDAAVLKFDVYPDSAFNGIVGFSKNKALKMEDLVGAIQFHPDGTIKVADASGFRADAAVEYEYDARFAVTIDLNVAKQAYSVSVKPPKKSEIVIASRYSLMNPVDAVNNLVAHVDIDPLNGGRPYTSLAVKNVKVTPTTAVDEENEGIPDDFRLSNYPNPFNSTTTISYHVEKTGRVELAVSDITGRQLVSLVNGFQTAGLHKVNFDAQELPSGIYVCTLKSMDSIRFSKIVLIK
ncbi:MAG: T9SS C-terminal target domain-containing protein [Calditrichaeota bacterium]|nr:MAG: T9SS C-terminal target domain-containing protein [Calditrichota bacterium]